jgi:hypothetical protein
MINQNFMKDVPNHVEESGNWKINGINRGEAKRREKDIQDMEDKRLADKTEETLTQAQKNQLKKLVRGKLANMSQL